MSRLRHNFVFVAEGYGASYGSTAEFRLMICPSGKHFNPLLGRAPHAATAPDFRPMACTFSRNLRHTFHGISADVTEGGSPMPQKLYGRWSMLKHTGPFCSGASLNSVRHLCCTRSAAKSANDSRYTRADDHQHCERGATLDGPHALKLGSGAEPTCMPAPKWFHFLRSTCHSGSASCSGKVRWID